jgi:hypothetical protein
LIWTSLAEEPIYECTPYNVLWAECSEGSLIIDLLLKKTKASKLPLVHVVAKVDNAGVEEWVDELMRVAYPGASFVYIISSCS